MAGERECALESLLSLKRAGADLILTYYATQAAKSARRREVKKVGRTKDFKMIQ